MSEEMTSSPPHKKAPLFCLLFALLTTGLAFMIYEIIFLRELYITLGGTVYASSATLSSVMLGLFLGSQIFGVLSSRSRNIAGLFVVIELLMLLSTFYTVPLLRIVGGIPSWGLRFLLSFLIILVPSCLIGGELPVAMQFLEKFIKKGKLGFYTGLVYGADTLGALVGALILPFLLMPFVGAYKSTLIAGAANGLSALAMAYWSITNRKTLAAGAGLFLILLLGGGFSPLGALLDQQTKILTPFRATKFQWKPDNNREKHWVWETPYQKIHMIEYKNKPRDIPKGLPFRYLLLDGTPQTFTAPHEYTEVGYFALMSHSSPKRVLMIGCGDGDLISKMLNDPRIETLDHVEIDKKVIEVSQKYFPLNSTFNGKSLWKDPRVTLHLTDGRQFLRNTKNFYDIIICDLPHVTHEGGSVFYTKEFFTLAKTKLNPGGIFLTHAYAVNQRSRFAKTGLVHLSLVARTLQTAFGNNLYLFSRELWPQKKRKGDDYTTILMAYKDSIDLDPDKVYRRFAGLSAPPQFLTRGRFLRYIKSSYIPKNLNSLPVTTDDKPSVLYARRWEKNVFQIFPESLFVDMEYLEVRDGK